MRRPACKYVELRRARGRWPRRVPHRRRDRGSISMSTSKLSIAGHVIGLDSAPYAVAEAGSNFNQSLDTAKRMIEVAADSGAQAVKFPLFRAEAFYPVGSEMYDIFTLIESDAALLPALRA